MRIFAQKHTFYIFKTQQLAVDNCYDWFPQPQNVPDADHYIKAYVIRPNGTIPYENADPTPPVDNHKNCDRIGVVITYR